MYGSVFIFPMARPYQNKSWAWVISNELESFQMSLSHFKWAWVISSFEESDSSINLLQLCKLQFAFHYLVFFLLLFDCPPPPLFLFLFFFLCGPPSSSIISGCLLLPPLDPLPSLISSFFFLSSNTSAALIGSMMAPTLVVILGTVNFLTVRAVFQWLPMGVRMLRWNWWACLKLRGRSFTWEEKETEIDEFQINIFSWEIQMPPSY